MPLQKQPVSINFAQGIDTKIDPNQLPIGKFVNLTNSVFDKIGLLKKRNGFGSITSLPDRMSTFLTTFNGSLTAIGEDFKAFSQGPMLWIDTGPVYPLQLSTLPLIRDNINQIQSDTAISNNGLVCTVYSESQASGSASYKYAIADATTGQNVIKPTQILSPQGFVIASPRVFILNNNFIVAFGTTNSAAASRLQYFFINTANPSTVGSVTDISSSYRSISSQGAFDGVVANNGLYLSWNGATSSGIKATVIDANLNQSNIITIASATASMVSVAADNTGSTPVIWTATYVTGTSSGVVVATNSVSGSSTSLTTLFSAKTFIASSANGFITNIAMAARNGKARIFYENYNVYPNNTSVQTNYITSKIAEQSGSVGSESQTALSVGLASKAFIVGSGTYFLATYSSPYQPTYFLMNSTGGVVAKLAYGNGIGYVNSGLPLVFVNGDYARVSYLVKDLIQPVNKDTNPPAGTQVAGVYTQTGIGLANFSFGSDNLVAAEIGNNLHLNGGFLWSYDGYRPVEHGFHLYPDSVVATTAGTAGSITAGVYYYQATYEWSDNQGNILRSAPSIPIRVTSSGSTSTTTVYVPTMRLTYKTDNPIKVVLYRWSTAQQNYYQVTSVSNPVLNSVTDNFVTITDRSSDDAILGNNLLYTTGGVVENIEPPAVTAMTLFDSRLWCISAENQNSLIFSKQVIDATPVEMSDLFTLFVSPNASAQGPTGPMRCLAPMDDKLIIFKKNAIYFINGRGPDNTGANSQYSEPTFITGTVGCDNQSSIVLTPNGLMFQSDKGIWLLGRDLSTQYIGKEVEIYNSDVVLSAVAVPGTNQVRFTLKSGTTLMYDYFVGQWGMFSGISGISSTLYQGLHTYIDQYGRAFQETVGSYLDGSRPVLMSFKTGWFSLAGLQGYKRIYEGFLLGQFKTPHRLTMGIAYDYQDPVTQLISIIPDNYTGTWGSGTSWGSVFLWGGNSNREQWQLNFENQQCQSFQLSFNEYYDSSQGVPAGAGLTMSGITIISGLKASYPKNIATKNKKG